VGFQLHLSISVDPDGPRGMVHLVVGDNYRARVRARAAALPCRMNSIDRVSIGGGLEGLGRSEAVALLRECRRILTPDGRLTVGALGVDAFIARHMEPADVGDNVAGRGGTLRHGKVDECERLTRRLRDCCWIGSADELRELASQVGLTSLPGDQAPGRKEEHTGWLILEFTKQLPSLAKNRPLVSVLIPAFKPQFFAEAVESVLAQTYDNLELVICDDCQTAEIQMVVGRYAPRDPRIKYFRNESRLGSRQNHIRCLGLASGELIKFLSDDDRLHPACLERMVTCLIGFPEITLVTSHRQCIDETGHELPDLDVTLRPVSEDSRIDGAALARAVLLQFRNTIGEPSTVMCRRRDLVDTRPDLFSFGGRRYETTGDVVMWLNLLSKGDAIYLVETLSYFRLHRDQEQRSEHVRASAEQTWQRMRTDANRMGLLPENAPTRAQWTPLGVAKPWWPESIADGVGQAMAELKGGEESAGRDRLRRAHGLLPQDPWLLLLLGRSEQQSGNLGAARQYLVRAAVLAPDLACVHRELAVVMHRLGQNAEAEAAATRTLMLNPSDAAALAVLAKLSGARLRASGTERLEADPELDGRLEQWPAEDQLIGGLVDVQGWVVSRLPGTVAVQVLVDGCTWPAWITPLLGPDVERAFSSSPPANPMPRFYLMLDTRSIPDGRHVLTFVARCSGRALILGQRPVVIRNRELLGVADGPAGELVEHLVRERDTMRRELEGRLDALARERDAQRLELEERLNAFAQERDAERLELEGRLDAVIREGEALTSALEVQIERLVRERDQATAHLRRMLHAWPVRLYGRAVRLPGAGRLMRRIAGFRR
jgi:hypothetical protein